MNDYKIIDEKALGESFKQVGELVGNVFNGIAHVVKNVAEEITKCFQSISASKRISRKRFLKLLMSGGIQRNDAQKIVEKYHKKNGTYTYLDVLVEWRNLNDE